MDQFRMPLIGEKAPEFQAETSMGPVRFPADYKGRWVVFFSHPGDLPSVSAQAENIGRSADACCVKYADVI